MLIISIDANPFFAFDLFPKNGFASIHMLIISIDANPFFGNKSKAKKIFEIRYMPFYSPWESVVLFLVYSRGEIPITVGNIGDIWKKGI